MAARRASLAIASLCGALACRPDVSNLRCERDGQCPTSFYCAEATCRACAAAGCPERPAPAAPAWLRAAPATKGVGLVWAAVDGADDYEVRSGESPESLLPLASTSAAELIDAQAPAGMTLYYSVAARSVWGRSAASPVAVATVAPEKPARVYAVASSQGVSLDWVQSRGATEYQVSRAQAGLPAVQIAATTKVSFSDTSDLVAGTSYEYSVRATNAGGPSADAARATVIAQPAGPPAPALFRATSRNRRVDLSWSSVGQASAYALWRTSTAGLSPIYQGPATTFSDLSVQNGIEYTYSVIALRGGLAGRVATAIARPVRELCVVDGARYTVSTFDADSDGVALPLRQFGWLSGLHASAAVLDAFNRELLIATDDGRIDVYPADVSGPAPRPTRSLTLGSTALGIAIDGVRGELYVGMADQVAIYPLTWSGVAPTPRTLNLQQPLGSLMIAPQASELLVLGTDGTLRAYEQTATTDSPKRAPLSADGFAVAPRGAIYSAADDAVVVAGTASGVAAVALFARSASGITAPLRAPLAGPGTQISQPLGLALGADSLLVLDGGGRLLRFPRTAQGEAPPIAALAGPLSELVEPTAIAADATGELVIVNAAGNGLLAFAQDAAGDVAPLRAVSAAASGVSRPSRIALRPGGAELVLLSQGPRHAVAFYDSGADGPAASPRRTIAGLDTGLDASDLTGLAIDEKASELWVARADGVLLAFDLGAAGNAAPKRQIAFAERGILDLAFRASTSELHALDDSGRLAVLAAAGAGAAAPSRSTAVPFGGRLFLDPSGIFASTRGQLPQISVLPPELPQDASILRSFSLPLPAGPGALVTDPTADEIFVAIPDGTIAVLPRGASGISPPLRRLGMGGGSRPIALAMCN